MPPTEAPIATHHFKKWLEVVLALLLVCIAVPVGWAMWQHLGSPTASVSDVSGKLFVRSDGGLYDLVFRSQGAATGTVLTKLQSNGWPRLSVYHDHLYALLSGVIFVIDPNSGSMTPLPSIATSTGSVVLDFYVRGDRLWYLWGPRDCALGASCAPRFYEIPAPGGTPTFLARAPYGVSSIVGYDPASRQVYLLHTPQTPQTDCVSFIVSGYSYASGSLNESFRDPGCTDARAHRAALRSLATMRASLSGATSPAVLVVHGHLSAPSNATTSPAVSGNFVFPLP